jgi:hypothetical protein
MNRPAAFRAADLTRAIKATLKAGVSMDGAIIRPTGEIEIKFRDGKQMRSAVNEWDKDLG